MLKATAREMNHVIKPRGASRPPRGVSAFKRGSYAVYRPGHGWPPVTAEALAPGAPVPALVVRPVVAPPRAPCALTRALRPTVVAPASAVSLPAGCPSSALSLAPAPRPAAKILGAPDTPGPP